MTLQTHRDPKGTHYTVPGEGAEYPEVTVWWSREARRRVLGRTVQEEYLVIRQDDGNVSGAATASGARADVVTLSFGQVYDLIAALNKAVENT